MNIALGAAIRDLAKSIKQHRERMAQRRPPKRKPVAGGRELERVKLTQAEKRELQAKILEHERQQFKRGTSRKMRRMFEQQTSIASGESHSSKTVQSTEAYSSLILGLLGLGSVLFISIFWSAFWVPALAIMFGVKGLHTIKRARVLQFTGRGIAITGISLGVLSYIVLMLAFIPRFFRLG